MKCPRCQHDNPAALKFCGECGTRLAVLCSSCGAANAPTQKFCGECGGRLTGDVSAAPPAPEAEAPEHVETGRSEGDAGAAQVSHGIPGHPLAERRQLTIMFCDLAGSTALSASLDPEDMRGLVRAYQDACGEVIARSGGYIAQYLGDGLLVYFGYPQAHEDDARRAVRAGLGILDAMERLNTRLGRAPDAALAVRVGIHTGLVVVGEMGAGGRREQLALGATPNIAARLQAIADPNTVVISAATRHLIERWFVCADLGARMVKGISGPLEVFSVLGEAHGGEPSEVPGSPLTPLVGREQELGLVLTRWEQVKDGLGQVLLLGGEAGVGKSRLLHECRERVGSDPPAWWAWRCSPYHQDSALHPVIEFFHHSFGVARADSAAAKTQTLEEALARHGMVEPEARALWAGLLSLPAPRGQGLPILAPQRQKQKTLEAIWSFLLAEVARRPLVLVLEDLHWVDPSTLDLLTLVVDQAATIPLLVLSTFRPDFRPPWSQRAHVTYLTLNRLTRQQTSAMVSQAIGTTSLPAEVIGEIVAKTDGVPLFVEELTKSVLESGLLREDDSRHRPVRPLPPLAIPATLHDSLMARLDRLAPVKELAQLAATLGRQFSWELVRAVAPLDDARLQDALTQLVRAELLYQRGIPPRATYLFKHALIQDAAYESSLKSARQQLHQRIADTLVAQFPEIVDTQPELVAHHYTGAGLTTRAIAYWERAGKRANSRSAPREAVAHYRRALDLLAGVPDTRERATQELGLQTALGNALMVTQGYAAPDVERAFRRARELGQAIGEHAQLIPILLGLRTFYQVRGDLGTARELAEQIVGLAQDLPDSSLVVHACAALGHTLYTLGEFEIARDSLERGLHLYDPARHREFASIHGLEPGIFSLCTLAWVLWHLGYPDQALARSQQAISLGQQVGHAPSLEHAFTAAAILHHFRRDAEATHDNAEKALVIATERGFQMRIAIDRTFRGWALAAKGHGPDGIREVRDALVDYQATGAEAFMPHFLAVLADTCGRAGRTTEALDAVSQGLALAVKNGDAYSAAELHRLQGTLHLEETTPDVQQAAVCFQRAVDVARAQHARSPELRATVSLSRLMRTQGNADGARDLLAIMVGWFTEGLDSRDVQEARVLLDELP